MVATMLRVHQHVAPHWGAWIEIRETNRDRGAQASHPTGVRGLKSQGAAGGGNGNKVAPHWGAWIEMLRLSSRLHASGRTPLGCVD